VALRAKLNPAAALIALGHCHLHGGEESPESERRLVIGGAEAIGTDIFDPQIAYVALGHLHRAQQFDNGRIRYSGSPIPLSFAEKDYHHQLVKLTFIETQLTSTDEILIPRAAMMLRIPAAGAAVIDDVISQLEALTLDESLLLEQYPFVEVRITEEGPDPMRRRRIEQAMDGKPLRLASIKIATLERNAAGVQSATGADQMDLKTIDPEDVFQDAYRKKYGHDPDSRLLAAFREILLQEARG